MTNKPNIIIVFPDQLRRQALSCYGDKNIVTKNIDYYAENGAKFTKACSSYPVCVPFRYTLLTGQAAHQDKVPAISYTLPEEKRTLADEYNDAGYETIYVGKWHLSGVKMNAHTPMVARVPNNARGRWSKWYGFEVSNTFQTTRFYEDDAEEDTVIDEYQTDGLFSVAMKHLAEKRDKTKPFCLVLSTEPPHDSVPSPAHYEKYPVHTRFPNKHDYFSPPEYYDKWQKKDISLPDNYKPRDAEEEEYFCQGRKAYYAMIENLDDNVGRLKEFLQQNDLAENTIVVLLSDHGEMGGCNNTNGAHKSFPYEDSVGIPLVVYDPRQSPTIIDSPVNTEDLFPTLLGLTSSPCPKEACGTDCTPLVQKKQEELPRPGVMLEFVNDPRFVFNFHQKAWRGFRSKDYKYTVIKEGDEATKKWHFFDLKNDPAELNNLIDRPEYQAEIQKHHQYLQAEISRTEDFFELNDDLDLYNDEASST
jgi:arylsulfatase A-like enzyme